MKRRWWLASLAAGLLVAGCQGSAPGLQTVEVMTSWQGSELASFRQVLDAFQRQTGIQYKLTPDISRDVDEPLGNRLSNPPDVVILPQPGEISLLVHEHHAVAELDPATQAAVRAYYDPLWRQAGMVDGRLYGVVFKGADKSIMWYRPSALQRASISSPPQTWDQFLTDASKLATAGQPPVIVAGADGWTLTDWFENILLTQAGPDLYDQLARHEIKWTDEPVVRALRTLAQLFGAQQLLKAGTQGALTTTYEASVASFIGDTPPAGFLYEASFVETGLAPRAVPHRDYDLAPFPSAGSTGQSVIIGGDTAIGMRGAAHPAAAQQLLRYLASPEAAMVWIQSPEGAGYLSPNREVPASAYPSTSLASLVAQQIRNAAVVRYDMSDTLPPDFGSRDEWTDMQRFLARPGDVEGVARELEEHASTDLGSGGRPAELPSCGAC